MIQQGGEAGNLSRLNDIQLPQEVSLLPSAPGWPWVWLALLITLFALALGFVRRYRALSYRREALRELSGMRGNRQLEALPVLLKLVAMQTHPRSEVASLSGVEWSTFLDRTGAAGCFGAGLGETLSALTYGPAPDEGLEELLDGSETWIRAQGPTR